MVNSIISFSIAAVISFIGSFQPGPVNLQVLYSGFNGARKQALLCAVGGVLPEFVYCSMAMFFHVKLQEYKFDFVWLKLLNISVLLLVGIYLLKSISTKEATSSTRQPGLFSGFMAGMLNPFLLPFWLFVIFQSGYLEFLTLNEIPEQIAFIAGSGAGAFLFLYGMIIVAPRLRDSVEKKIKLNSNRIIGGICIILALTEIIRCCYL
jgi:threonine/homoserine/homoserine lactone efflux protein